jgi:hypothetical protein
MTRLEEVTVTSPWWLAAFLAAPLVAALAAALTYT